jgi:hypothetical protein
MKTLKPLIKLYLLAAALLILPAAVLGCRRVVDISQDSQSYNCYLAGESNNYCYYDCYLTQ